MILGISLMWVAFFASLVALLGYFLTMRERKGWLKAARLGHIVMTAALVGAAGWLMHLFLTHQFQIQYVYKYSSRNEPLHFLISSFWAGQEGTFLLWAVFTAIMGLVVMKTAKKFEAGVMTFVLLLQNFLIVILLKLSPFASYPTTPPDGAGLNPLLQDYWMVIHPPLLFVGFAAFTIPAAFAMHGMVRKDTDEWVKGALPWTAFGVLVLGTAICLGGYWAYRTLGWGGYWGWDPVENSSFVPWLFGVALLHGLVVQTHRGSLKRLNLFLAICAFMLVLYSTFLTRSGVLGDFSVHSFVDLGINGFLIAFVVSYALLGYGLYFWRVRGMNENRLGSGLTREYGIFLGALVVTIFSVLVLIGTSAPLLTRLGGKASNVSTGYYKAIAVPFGIMISLLLAVSPHLVWNARHKDSIWKSLIGPAILAALATVLLFLLGVKSPGYAALCFSAALALFVNLEIMLDAARKNWVRAGGYLVHVGLGLMLIGIVTSTIYDRTESVVLPKGQLTNAMGYRMTWNGARSIDGGSKAAYDISVLDASGKTFTASPIMFYSEYNKGVMRRPAIKRFLQHDLYLSPQGVDHDEAMDKMDKEDVTLEAGQETTVGSSTIKFEKFEPLGMSDQKIELGGVLTVTSNGRSETVEPVLLATGEGQEYREATAGVDGSKIVMRRADPKTGRAQFYIRQPGSAHYNMPTDALYLNVEIKPYIMILWIGTFLCIGGLLMTVIYRGRTAQMMARKAETQPVRKQGSATVGSAERRERKTAGMGAG